MIATSCSPRDLDIVVSTKLVKSVRYFSRDFAGRPGPDCQLLHDLLPKSSHAAHWMVKVNRFKTRALSNRSPRSTNDCEADLETSDDE